MKGVMKKIREYYRRMLGRNKQPGNFRYSTIEGVVRQSTKNPIHKKRS